MASRRQRSSSKVEGASKFEPISPEPSSPLRPGVSASPSARRAKPRSSSKVGLPSDDGSDSPRGSSASALGGASGARRNSRSSSKCGEGEMLRSVSLDAASPGAAAPGSTSASAAARSPTPTTRPAPLREVTEALARGESMSPLGGSPRGGVGRSPRSMHMMPSIDDFVERLLSFVFVKLTMNETVDAFINMHASTFSAAASEVARGEYTLQQMQVFREYEELMESELKEFATTEGFASTEGMYQALSKSISASDVPSTRDLGEDPSRAVLPTVRGGGRSPWTVVRDDDASREAEEAAESQAALEFVQGEHWQTRKGMQQRARKNQKLKQILAAFEFRYFARMMRERADVALADAAEGPAVTPEVSPVVSPAASGR